MNIRLDAEIKTVGEIRRRLARLVILFVLPLLVCVTWVSSPVRSSLADTAPIGANIPATASADPLPTVQENGVVWAEVTVGDTVFATGKFSETWPAGQSATSSDETARANLLAFNIKTGDLDTSFNHDLNAQGLGISASPDGSRIYVVGDFTKVDSLPHNHIAAFDTKTGALVSDFAPSISGSTAAVAATNSTVYAGGNFFNVGGVGRTRLAAFDAASGALLSWAPTVNNQVSALSITPDASRVIIGGRFSELNATNTYEIGAVDALSGEATSYAASARLDDGRAADGRCGITSLSSSGSQIFGTAFATGCGGTEARFALDPDSGEMLWIDDCLGDSYSTFPIGQVLYSASHSHDCSTSGSFPQTAPTTYHRALAETTYATGTLATTDAKHWNYKGVPRPTILPWYPTLKFGTITGQNQAAWSVTGNSDYVVMGGEFPSVNGVPQAGLVRFAASSIAPNKVGPVPASSLTPAVSSPGAGAVAVSWKSTWDADNQYLTYNILRDGSSTPIYSVTAASSFWQLPTLTYTDLNLTPGTSHTYRIQVVDPFGNKVGSLTSSSVTVSSSGTVPANAPPVSAFTTSCAEATCSFDASGSTDSDGAITSYRWSFGDGASAVGQSVVHTFASNNGSGKENETVTLDVTDDSNATSSDATTIAVTPAADVGPNAVFLSRCSELECRLDATGSNDPDGSVSSYDWDFGDGTTGSGATPTHAFPRGGEYTVRLTVTDNDGATDTITHTVATNAPPTAAFTSTCTQLTCHFDGGASTDSDGTVASYAWDYGDGTSGTGVTSSHTYGAAGAHTVTLTVTDNGGAASSPISHAVTMTAPTARVWASDAFHRTVESGWGTPKTGGAWSDSGCSALSVADSYGHLTDARGTTCSTWLPDVNRSSTDTSVTMRAPSVPKGGLQVAVVGRRISAADNIQVRLEFKPDGNVVSTLVSHVGSKATELSKAVTVKPVASSNGQIHVELRAYGTSPTVVQAKVWQDGEAKPSNWTVRGTTATSALQHQGSVGIAVYLEKPHNPKTAALRVTSFASRDVLN